jgi:Flp pilus assembly protein TadG
MMKTFLKSLAGKWWASRDGTAAVEFVLVFPIMLIMLVGVDELGTGIMINQKCIASAQTVADLIARNKSITQAQLDDYVTAGRLALDPYSTATLGFDIVSLQFDSSNNPQQVWRYTTNMQANSDGIDGAAGLGVSGDGVLAVTVTYYYTPPFASMVINAIPMEEIAYIRGRASAVINMN